MNKPEGAGKAVETEYGVVPSSTLLYLQSSIL